MSDLEVFATPMNYGSTSGLSTSNNSQSPTRPSYFDRHVWRAQQGYAQSHGNTVGGSSYAAPGKSAAGDARSSETSQLEDGEVRDENPRLKNTSESEYHPRLGTAVPPETVIQPVHAYTHPNHSALKVVLSLRGGGDNGGNESPSKKLRPEGSGRYRLNTLTTDTSTDKWSAPQPVPPPTNRTINPNRYFSNAFSTFQALPTYLQLYTQGYLKGEAAVGWATQLALPLMEMLERLRYCVLLLCEAENPTLRHITRSPGRYTMFRNGVSANCVAQDDDAFVQAVRRNHPNLDRRLRRPHERMRILWALRTVDFPKLMA
ncbi:hypothetical protein GGR51DRAFT_577363 [Nemania sp. FL0031]|nr:hypothetical protein GGR51DRAFT_577363 [Nemania sp. FL0031]